MLNCLGGKAVKRGTLVGGFLMGVVSDVIHLKFSENLQLNTLIVRRNTDVMANYKFSQIK